MHMGLIPLAVLLTVLINVAAAQASDDQYTRTTLKGLPGVWVVVEGFSDDEKRAGFDMRTFHTDVELKLRLAGIKVLREAEMDDTEGRATLYLNVTAAHSKRGDITAFAIDLSLMQSVLLERNRIPTMADTWRVGRLDYGSVSSARDFAKNLVDMFINAWLSVNPK